jgi:hypothetical protein
MKAPYKWDIPKITLSKTNNKMKKFKDLTFNDRIVNEFEITKYDFKMINGEPKIVISEIKVLDDSGKYIKFAKLDKVIEYLSYYYVSFKAKE